MVFLVVSRNKPGADGSDKQLYRIFFPSPHSGLSSNGESNERWSTRGEERPSELVKGSWNESLFSLSRVYSKSIYHKVCRPPLNSLPPRALEALLKKVPS